MKTPHSLLNPSTAIGVLALAESELRPSLTWGWHALRLCEGRGEYRSNHALPKASGIILSEVTGLFIVRSTIL
ncbi:MAG: hypothetical protein SFV81_00210 [Pirellulaceae bacterium]|nr:hypothetical protein [Pirellulaceae bacterium]